MPAYSRPTLTPAERKAIYVRLLRNLVRHRAAQLYKWYKDEIVMLALDFLFSVCNTAVVMDVADNCVIHIAKEIVWLYEECKSDVDMLALAGKIREHYLDGGNELVYTSYYSEDDMELDGAMDYLAECRYDSDCLYDLKRIMDGVCYGIPMSIPADHELRTDFSSTACTTDDSSFSSDGFDSDRIDEVKYLMEKNLEHFAAAADAMVVE